MKGMEDNLIRDAMASGYNSAWLQVAVGNWECVPGVGDMVVTTQLQ